MINEFLKKDNIFAVVGASSDRSKYGNIVFRDLLRKGYKVYPVNPNHSEIEGVKCYKNLKELPEKPDVISIVVPPNITEKVVEMAFELGINKIWMQPGAESKKAIEFCNKNNIKVIYNACILVEN